MPVAALCFLRLTSWRSSANQRALGGLGSTLCTRCLSLHISCLSQTKPSVLCVRNKAEGIHNSMEEKRFFSAINYQMLRDEVLWEMMSFRPGSSSQADTYTDSCRHHEPCVCLHHILNLFLDDGFQTCAADLHLNILYIPPGPCC